MKGQEKPSELPQRIKTMHTKESTQQLRSELKAAFPSVKFSVRMRGGSAVNIEWIDGPTKKEVEAIADKYEKIDRCQFSGEILSGGNDYVFCIREYSSVAFQDAVKSALAKNWGMWSHLVFDEIIFNEEGNKIKENIWVKENGQIYFFDELVSSQLKDKSFCNSPEPTIKAEEQSVPVEVSASVRAVTVTENQERGGVEVRFPVKPSQETLDALKLNGFRWSRFNACWYAKKTDETMTFAKSLISEPIEAQPEVLALPPATVEEETEDYSPIAPISITSATLSFVSQEAVPSLHSGKLLALAAAQIESKGYVVVAELPAIEPIVFTATTPQQELKTKLKALSVDELSAEKIYDLLQALG